MSFIADEQILKEFWIVFNESKQINGGFDADLAVFGS
jgi:hypothetical protein